MFSDKYYNKTTMNKTIINEQSNLAEIAGQVKKGVSGLLMTYFALIFGTILLFLAVVAIVCFLGFAMFEGGRIYGRAIALMIGAIVVAGICVNMVLKPLFSMFESKKMKGVEIGRKDYPELFSMIDDVVAKAECLQPKHVYISDECNAYVCYPNIWGYIFHGKQNLTIGLPLLTTLNKTEFKAILSHEFGHFTQKSVKMNRIANLSEFICASISRSSDDVEQADDNSYEAKARAFARLVTKIMNKQYLKVAPLNGVLSRAQEFDADSYSYQIVGTQAAISSLSKISFFSDQWGQAMRYLLYMMREEERTPQSVKMVVDTYVANANKKYKLGLTPDSHLTSPIAKNSSRISWANDDTHPSMNDRCAAISKMPVKDTEWDNSPALDFFSEDTISKTFNAILPKYKDILFENRTVFVKKDVTEEEVFNYVDSLTPDYLDNFYCGSLFFRGDTYVNANEDHPEYESFPFTIENATVLNEFWVAYNDLQTLQQIVDENSAERSYYYAGTKYSGVNVPIQQHRDYCGPLVEKSVEIARHCNWWMSQKAMLENANGVVYNYMAAASAVLGETTGLEDAINTVNAIVQAHDNSTKAKEYINNIDSHFRADAGYMMELVSEGQSRFSVISGWLGVEEEVVANVVNYFEADTRDSDYKLVEVYSQFQNIVREFRSDAWARLKKVWIMPEIVGENN